MTHKQKLEVLCQLYLGGLIAEQDDLLNRCFIRHPVMTELLRDQKDIVLGAKGAGKSAVWKELFESRSKYQEIKDVILSPVTNPTGDPEFRDVLAVIAAEQFPSDAVLRVAWRIYLLGQMWEVAEAYLDTKAKKDLETRFKKVGIGIPQSGSIKKAFAYAVAKAQALEELDFNWAEKKLSIKFDHDLLKAGASAAAIPFNDLLKELDFQLKAAGKRVWLMLDRLDEIVLGSEDRENAVLKGLLLAFRDLSGGANCRVKLFLRDDVYDRVTAAGHFPALSHVGARAAGPLKWGEEELLHFAVRRFAESDAIKMHWNRPVDLGSPAWRTEFFYSLFPRKIDKGRAADSFKWILDRITDGNRVVTPRDVLAVFETARVLQIEEMRRDESAPESTHLFSADVIRSAVKSVAKSNLTTRIYAEYPDLRPVIKAFEGGKADHNEETLKGVLGQDWKLKLERLERIGFFYRRKRENVSMWTIPFFYTNAIEARRGAAFELPNDDEAEDDPQSQ